MNIDGTKAKLVVALVTSVTVSLFATTGVFAGNGNGNGNGNGGGNGQSSNSGQSSGNGGSHGSSTVASTSPGKSANARGRSKAEVEMETQAEVASVGEPESKEKKDKNGKAIDSQLGALHAVHANLQAFLHASPNSRVGRIANYALATVATENAATTLADAEASLAAAHTAAGDALSAFVGSPELASFEGSYPDYADYSLATLQSRSTELSQIAAPTPEQTTELMDLNALLTSAAGSNLVSTAAAEDALTAAVAADQATLDAAEVVATDALAAAANKPISDDVREYVDAALEEDGILDYYRTH
jgi:hypothetical protein